MYYVITYDVGVDRVNKVKKLTRQFLKWEQNSVVSGELSESQITQLKSELVHIINHKEDHIIILGIRSKKFFDREDLGTPKSELDGGTLFI